MEVATCQQAGTDGTFYVGIPGTGNASQEVVEISKK